MSVDLMSTETGKRRSVQMHRLVKAAFCGQDPDRIVNHKDKNRTNNCLENLEYLTQQENVIHAIVTSPDKVFKGGGRKVIVTDKNGVETEYESMVACGKALGYDRKVIATMCKNGSIHNEGFTCRRVEQ